LETRTTRKRKRRMLVHRTGDHDGEVILTGPDREGLGQLVGKAAVAVR